MIALAILIAALQVGCNKTAEDTNKPVIIDGFEFTVDADSVTPVATLQLAPGNILTIKVNYTDPDAGDEPDPGWYSYTWAVERIGAGSSVFNPNEYFIVSGENPCIWAAPDVTGFYRFRVEVRDRYQSPTYEEVVIEINSNRQPRILGVVVSEPSPWVNEEITITVDATDPDGDFPLDYGWQATGGYFTSENDQEAVWLSPTAGPFTITVIVTDQAGGSASRDLPIIVKENHPPHITGWNADPSSSVVFDELVTITLTVTDEDGDALIYSWSSDCGTFNSVNQNQAVWRAPSQTASCTVSCTVEDNKGGEDSIDIIINVS